MTFLSPSFPFEHVVITFPDEASAQAAESGPLRALQTRYNGCKITATTDPYGARVGSGGGSLAALLLLHQQHHKFVEAQKVNILILHAGGESSRCPTQMILGKAWTSLPCSGHQCHDPSTTARSDNDENIDKSKARAARILSPVELWLDLAESLFSKLPKGSVVVAASDTLLQLGTNGEDNMIFEWGSTCPSSAVVGLAVPAPLETAQNHGVFVLAKEASNGTSSRKTFNGMAQCARVYQKPSLTELRQRCKPFIIQNQQMAWIDTGVVVFLPDAAGSLYQLGDDLSGTCTWQGIRQSWQTSTASGAQEHLEVFAKRMAVKVDLYSHMLQALQVAPHMDNEDDDDDESARWRQFMEQHSDLPEETCQAVWKALSMLPLFVAFAHDGHFLHLGTTVELQEFLLEGSYERPIGSNKSGAFLDDTTSRRSTLCQRFGRQLGLTRRLQTLVLLQDQPSETAVLYHCLLSSRNADSRIGTGTIVEHSWIETGHQPLIIGQNCLVSGLRSVEDSQQDAFVLPDGILVQMLELAANSSCSPGGRSYVYMLLGVEDGIKKNTTLYGQEWAEFLSWADLTETDLWDENAPKLLWTARLHPVLSTCDDGHSFGSVFSWLSAYLSEEQEKNASWYKWKKSRRLSLAEIRDHADASEEFAFREQLATLDIPDAKVSHCKTIRKILVRRKHETVNCRYAVEEFASTGCIDDLCQALLTLEQAAELSLKENMYDVCGRSLMIQSGIFYELDNLLQSKSEDPAAEILERLCQSPVHNALLHSLRSFLQDLGMVKSLHVLERKENNSQDKNGNITVKAIGDLLEDIAHAMTMRCVCAKRQGIDFSDNADPLFDQWVLATSPARIDLAGGWTDTPPVCCEYGSVVTGVAVLLDGKLPLSCLCRIVSGSQGVRLRAESRSIRTGELQFSTDASLISFRDIDDFRNPTSDCALIKCALVCLGLTTIHEIKEFHDVSNRFQAAINTFCRSQQDCRLEIIATSLLPHGSGLGTSSILGGCVLAALGKCIGKDFLQNGASNELIDAVLILEQQLTTGGGFQDQVNGLIGGVKTVRCTPHTFPLELTVENLGITPLFRTEFDSRVVLAFTGQTRLAKNILRNVLNRWSKRTPEIVEAVSCLVSGAKRARESILAGDFESLADTFNEYWRLKRTMAGPYSGAEPLLVKSLISELVQRELIVGSSLCGAGGGGFIALMMNRGVTCGDLQAAIETSGMELTEFTWHDCKLSDEGCTLQVFPRDVDPKKMYYE